MRRHESKSQNRLLRPTTTEIPVPVSFATRQLWRTRALRQSAAVRRVIRGARIGTNGAVGTPAVVDALQRDRVGELMLTPRAIERQPAMTAALIRLALERDVQITTVVGGAAFELDLLGGGVAALLRRPSVVRVVDSRA